jgi:Flp pilus assembly protein TadD
MPNLPADEEVKAVQIMAAAMHQTPQSYTLLHAQCDFLRSKGKYEWALKLARQAVNCAPSEFVTWEKLADLYIDLGQYDSVCIFFFFLLFADPSSIQKRHC